MIRFNLTGAVMLLGAALIGFAIGAFGVPTRWSGSAAIVLMIIADVAFRLRSPVTGRDKWLAARAGGFLGFAPVWITGLILLAAVQFGLLE